MIYPLNIVIDDFGIW